MSEQIIFGGSCKYIDSSGVFLSPKINGQISTLTVEFVRKMKEEIKEKTFGVKKTGNNIDFFFQDIQKAFQDVKNNVFFTSGTKLYISMFDWEEFLFFRKG